MSGFRREATRLFAFIGVARATTSYGSPCGRLGYSSRAVALHYSPAWLAATKQRPNARRGNYARSKSGSLAISAAIRHASSLVMRSAGRASARFFLIVHVSHRKAVCVLRNEARGVLLWFSKVRGEAARGAFAPDRDGARWRFCMSRPLMIVHATG